MTSGALARKSTRAVRGTRRVRWNISLADFNSCLVAPYTKCTLESRLQTAACLALGLAEFDEMLITHPRDALGRTRAFSGPSSRSLVTDETANASVRVHRAEPFVERVWLGAAAHLGLLAGWLGRLFATPHTGSVASSADERMRVTPTLNL